MHDRLEDMASMAVEALTRGPRFRLVAGEGAVRAVNAEGAEFPAGPGLYAVHARDPQAVVAALGLEAPAAGASLLYVGKAEKSLDARDVRQHFGTGRTGRSTLRRTFAALLAEDERLQPIPRPGAAPTSKAPATFALTQESEERLTSWMCDHLELRVWARPVGGGDVPPLGDVERSVIGTLQPPLNLTHAGPRRHLRDARRRMVERAHTGEPARGRRA